MKHTLARYLALTALAFSFIFAASPAFVFAAGTNGSFELGTDPSVFTTVNAGDTTTITGWSVDSGSVDYIGSYWSAADGTRSIDLDGNEQGAISETFPTVIGDTYTVTFSLSGNPDGAPSLKDVQVSATGATAQDFTYDTSVMSNSLGDMKWTPETYTFVATSASTVLSFASQTLGAFGPALDNVVITEKAPECNANASQTIVSDTGTTNTTDSLPAVLLSFIHPAWTASIPGASWIWATDPVVTIPNTDVAKTFTHNFTVVGTPTGADLKIAADNSYTASVNGNVVSTDVTGATFASPQDIIIPAADLVTGTNTLSITVTNWGVNQSTDPAANPAGLLYKLTVTNNECVTPPPPPTNSNVHIFKFLDGVQATTVSANNVSFPMFTTTYNVPFTLGPTGWTTGDIAYEASTGPTPLGASYSANEDTNGALVSKGPDCDGVHPYALVGYSTGDTLVAAQNGAVTTDIPSFTNMQGEKYIIVRNISCKVTPPLKVHILKYLDGVKATTNNVAGGYQFPMTATWNAANIGAGTGTYGLGYGHGGAADLYGADTSPMSAPADYVTSEVTGGTSRVVAAPESCAPGLYLLNGYRTSSTSFADAATQPLEIVPHQYTGITADQYVIVDNTSCPTTGSLTIEKAATGGNATFTFTSDIPGGQAFTITTANGVGYSQTYSGLAPGLYHVTEGTVKGWTMMDNECSAITVTAGGNATCIVTNTNNKLLGEIRGTKYEDRDGDGKLADGDHHRLSGWTIYLDTNNNGSWDASEPKTLTDSHGNYRFSGLVPGLYHVREVGQIGWVQTYPTTGVYDVTVVAGKIMKKNNFGNFKLGSVAGMKYNDLNGNGRKEDANEPGLQGWTIQLKKGNTVVASTVTDANGNYSFTGLMGGTYTLAEVMQPTWRQTDHPGSIRVRSGSTLVAKDFGNTQKPKGRGDHDRDNDSH